MNKPSTHFTRLAIMFSLLMILLGGCASAAAPSQSAEYESAAGAPPLEQRSAPGEAMNDSVTESGFAQQVERLVIKNASLSLVVDDPARSMDTIARLAEELGGYLVSGDLSHYTTEGGIEVPRASITIRVPAERLDEALDRIQAESSREPLNKQISSQDVTSEYVDLQSRLRNWEATEAQLSEIMESATRTEDVLQVYEELARVRGEIESIKGQMQYYEQSAALSSISVDLLANAAVQPLTIGSWQPAGVAKDAVQALIVAMKFLVNAGIWLVILVLPVMIAILLPIVILWRLARRLLSARRKGATKAEPPAQPAASMD